MVSAAIKELNPRSGHTQAAIIDRIFSNVVTWGESDSDSLKQERPIVQSAAQDDFPLQWPRRTDHAFVEINPFAGAWAAPATNERLYRMIRGFYEAGNLLVEQSEAEPHQSSNLLYPIVFNYRQCLELHLKYLLMAFGPWAGEAPNFRHHDLVALWAKCRRVILHFEREKRTDRFLEAVEALIREFAAVDPGADAFRFCHDRDGKPIKLAIKAIDLGNLRHVMAGLHNFFECVDLHLRYGHGVAACAH